MSLFDEDKIKLQALKYAEQHKIVNQKSIDAYIAGFNFRDNSDTEIDLKSVEQVFRKNYESWEDDCGYDDLRGESYQDRKLEGHEARQIADSLQELIAKIEDFNLKYKRKY